MLAKTLTSAVCIAAALVAFAGCGVKLERPPIEFSYRPSLVGAGKILRLENRSSEPLREIRLEIRAHNGEVSYEHAEIGGLETVEVGWKKLGGFEIPDDAEIEVRARGYLLPLRVVLDAGPGGARGEGE